MSLPGSPGDPATPEGALTEERPPWRGSTPIKGDALYKYRLRIAYDGSSFPGWQIQRRGPPSIQEIVQRALSLFLHTPTTIVGAGRTDAGVHACGQSAHFSTDRAVDARRLLASLNGILPPTIRILEVEEVSLDFHARYSATGKLYHYYLHIDPIADPFKSAYALHLPHHFDLDRVRAALPFYTGRRDFTSFANVYRTPKEGASAPQEPDNYRLLWRLSVEGLPPNVHIACEGEGFLYKMVRNIVGTLLEVGSGRRAPERVEAIFDARDRRVAAATAPPHALFLMAVHYGYDSHP